MSAMHTGHTCPACGATITADFMGGHCPRCVAKTALGLKVRYFGDYELLEEVGRGGMGVVYRARQVSLNRIVAVKMLLHGELAGEELVRRFHEEAEVAASLQHPNIVGLHEVGIHNGQCYFSMDFVDGQSLDELVCDQPLPATQAAQYVEQMAGAIHYAHQHGILHRDLKPSNVLIDSLGQPRITDFGLAKRLHDHPQSPFNPQLTLSGQVLGAPAYMPPEQAAGKRDLVGVRSDVYSLGAILYHLLTGRPPFLGDGVEEILLKVQTCAPAPLRQVNPAVPHDLETICFKCLEKNPPDRYESAAALAEDLRRWQAGEPILARPLRLPERAWRACRRHPAGAFFSAAGGAGLLLAALLRPGWPPLRIPPQATELIALVDNSEAPARLCLTDPDGSFKHRLPIQSTEVDVSPDGKRICYNRHDGPTQPSIWLSRLDGRGQKRILAPASGPHWLDDDRLVYQALDMRSLWGVSIGTGRTWMLFDGRTINTNGIVGGGALSPDGKRLLLSIQTLVFDPAEGRLELWAPTLDIYVCDAEGQNPRAVWGDPESLTKPEQATTDTRPVWLGNDRIAWCRHARPGNRVQDMAIVACRLGETNFQALTPWKGYNYPLAGSPDGRQLLFATEDAPGAGNLELWIMNVDGTGRRKLLEGKYGCDFGLAARWVKRQP